MLDRDRTAVRDSIEQLSRAGYRPEFVDDCHAAFLLAREEHPSVAIVGRVSERLCKWEVCALLRAASPSDVTAIIATIPRELDRMRAQCMEHGADCVIQEPVDGDLLLRQIQSLIAGNPADGRPSLLAYGSVMMDVERWKVHGAGAPIQLRFSEFQLLRMFLERPEQVISRSELMTALGHAPGSLKPRSIDIHIRTLRAALAPAGLGGIIEAVAPVGYRLRQEETGERVH